MGWYLDGRVSAVIGTHTHVPTADETVRPGGTAYLTDVGMTGAYEGIIGFTKDRIIEKFLSQTPRSFETARRDIRLAGAVVSVDEESGKATAIERVQVRVD
jgi:2',3'-cyclic-nucleotide 2'-phosphodiesterase